MEPTRVLIRLSDDKVRKRLSAAMPVPPEASPVPDVLIRATVRAAAKVVRGELPARATMSAGACGLVDDAVRALTLQRWSVSSS
jgi:hypothetical protein